jgi:hypothetical protein
MLPRELISTCKRALTALCFASVSSITLLFASGAVYAQSDSNNCDYSSASVNGGWGWNPVTQESCAPLQGGTSAGDAEGPDASAGIDNSGNCDYSSAALYDGWGWDPVTLSSCPPIAQSAGNGRPVCRLANSDSDGDGYGWENGQTCIVGTSGETAPEGEEGDQNTVPVSARPICSSASVDSDGDGYGWENNQSCTVVDAGDDASETLSPSGAIATGTPEYQWPAVSGADSYRLIVRDSGGNGFDHTIDPLAAGCQTGSGTCRVRPDTGYFDNFLNWTVQAQVGGQTRIAAGPVSFKTPVSPNLQPISSNTASCEAYPAMAYDKFVVVNNIWNARAMYRSGWSQTINIEQQNGAPAIPSWQYDWLQESDGGIFDVKSYPEVVYGNKLGVHISGSKAETGLPETVANLQEFRVEYSFTHDHDAEVNVALESFFHSSCDIAGPCDDVDNRAFEMMIWVQNPSVRTPGDLALTGVMIDNRLWDVYIKPRSNKKYIAFTAQTDHSSGVLNWNRFVDWTVEWTKNNAEALEINQLLTNYCMGAIEIGTEVFNGKGTFTLDRYQITRN